MAMDVEVHLVIGLFAVSIAGGVVGVEGRAQQQRTARQDNRVGDGQFDIAREYSAVCWLADSRPEPPGIAQPVPEAAKCLGEGLAHMQRSATARQDGQVIPR